MYHLKEYQVEAQNSINKLANELAPKIQEAIKSFVGEKITKVDGCLTKKFASVVDGVIGEYQRSKLDGYSNGYASVHYLHVRKEYSTLTMRLSGCFQLDDTSCFYADKDVYLGQIKLDGCNETNVLKDLFELTPAPTYDYQEQLALRKEIDEAEAKVRSLKSKLLVMR